MLGARPGSVRTRQNIQSENWAPEGPDLLAVDDELVADQFGPASAGRPGLSPSRVRNSPDTKISSAVSTVGR